MDKFAVAAVRSHLPWRCDGLLLGAAGALLCRHAARGPGAGRAGARPGVVVAAVRLPEYLERPQLVTRSGDNRLQLEEFHQWGGNLGKDLTRVMAENLSLLLGSDAVVAAPHTQRTRPDYRVESRGAALRARRRCAGAPGRQVVAPARRGRLAPREPHDRAGERAAARGGERRAHGRGDERRLRRAFARHRAGDPRQEKAAR